LYFRDFALTEINDSLNTNEQYLDGFTGQIKGLSSSLGQLTGMNQKNRELFMKMIELGIPMPPLPPFHAVSPVDAVGMSGPHFPKPPAFRPTPDPYLEQLLRRNAELLAETQQLADANRALAAEASLLREQNDKLLALTGDLREQAARLDGQIRLLTSLNDLRKEQLGDVQAFTGKLKELNTRVEGEYSNLSTASNGLSGVADQISFQIQVIGQLNDALSKAIQNAQNKK